MSWENKKTLDKPENKQEDKKVRKYKGIARRIVGLILIFTMIVPPHFSTAQTVVYINPDDPMWIYAGNNPQYDMEYWKEYFDEHYWELHEDADREAHVFEDSDDSGSGEDDTDSDDGGNGWDDKVDESIHSKNVFITEIVPGEEFVTIKWKCNDNSMENFRVFRAEAGQDGSAGTYECITLITTWSYDLGEDGFYYFADYDYNIEIGKSYYYRIMGFRYDKATDNYKGDYYSAPMMVKVDVGKAVIKEAVSKNEDSIVLTWDNIAFATGYRVLRSDSRSGEFKQIAELDAAEKNQYKDTGLKLGNEYYYKLVAVCRNGVEIRTGEESETQKVLVTFSPVKIEKVEIVNVTTAKLKWEKHKKADKYEIYRAELKYEDYWSDEAELKYKKIKTIKGAGNTSLTIKKLKNGTTYSYKVRVVGKAGGKELNGEYSKPKNRVMDVLGYEWEQWDSKEKRIFGKKGYKKYKSASEANKYMKTIKIKTWDISSSGGKYTRTYYLTVHKNIASTVEQIFKEIYKGKEKFPIHDIGGYSWRGDNSTSLHCWGLAIDINANENYMIDGKKILAGSLWKPGKNPYSIPLDGDVANIMKKYGFTQGIWGDRRDYMHFSYFGS